MDVTAQLRGHILDCPVCQVGFDKHLFPRRILVSLDQSEICHQVFYNREDLWAPPQEKYEGKMTAMEPYYILMKLPGSDQLEYLLMGWTQPGGGND